MCSLLKAFHVPIAFHKVHYIGMAGGGEVVSTGRSGTHPRTEKGHNEDCFGLKISFFFLFFLKIIFGSL